MSKTNAPPENQFITEECTHNLFNAAFSMHQCRFQKDFYSDQLFHKMNIFLPRPISKAVIKRKAEFLAGRYCAQRAALSFGFTDINIEIGPDRCPIWPSSVIGSISHSNTYAIAVIGSATDFRGIGVDLEEKIDFKTIPKIRKQILSEEEFTYISELSNDLTTLFTTCFSVKESFFKAAYPSVRHYFDFDSISVKSIDLTKRKILFRLNERIANGLNEGDQFEGTFVYLPDNHVLTVVTLHHLSS